MHPRHQARALLLHLVFLLALSGTGAAPAAAQLIGRLEVKEVRFEGNRAFPSDSLARAIVTRATECRSTILQPFCWFGAEFATRQEFLTRRELPRDALRLQLWYRSRGYREVGVDTVTSEAPDGMTTVTFRVDEGRPVRIDSIEVLGAEGFEGSGLLEGLPIGEGDPLSTIRVDATRDTLVRRLTNRGYAHADVLRSFFIPTGDSLGARVTFEVAPGPRARYGHVTVQGNQNLSESTVLRTLQFRAGDVYRAGQLYEAQARLFGLEIVRSASVVASLDASQDSVVPITVTVQEGDLHRVRAGAGWSSSECLDVDSRWVSRNYFGGGRRLQVRGRVSNILADGFYELLCPSSGSGPFGQLNWLVSAEFNQPWIFSTRNSFQASLFAERQSLPDILVRKAVGATVALTRAIGPRTPLTASYRPELSRLDAAEILFCTSFLVCTPQDISVLQGANWVAPVALTFTRSTTDNVLSPSRGYTNLIDLEHASSWTGSNFPYNRLVAEITGYERIGVRGVLAGKLRIGWVGAGAFEELSARQSELDIVHPQKRFYAGGANSVRGFAQGRLGPRVLTTPVDSLLQPYAGCTPETVLDLTCNASDALSSAFEAFQPRPTGGTRAVEGSVELRFPLSSTIGGATFADFGQVWGDRQSIKPGALEVTPGMGLRYLSPIGPIRVDVAYRFRGAESLPVVTNLLRPYDPGVDREVDRILVAGQPIAWVATESLSILHDPVLYDDTGDFWRRLQIHISIGQAF